jgi:hypothetical protein
MAGVGTFVYEAIIQYPNTKRREAEIQLQQVKTNNHIEADR